MKAHGALSGLLSGLVVGLLFGVWLATVGASAVPHFFDGAARTILFWVMGLHALYGMLLGVTLAETGALADAKNSALIGALATGVLTYLGTNPFTALPGAIYGAFFGLVCFFVSYSLLRRTKGGDLL